MVLFNRATSQQARLKGLEARRSPELKKAWAETKQIKRLYFVKGLSGSAIAKLYGIEVRTTYRIIHSE